LSAAARTRALGEFSGLEIHRIVQASGESIRVSIAGFS
jgi:hypothetical protein